MNVWRFFVLACHFCATSTSPQNISLELELELELAAWKRSAAGALAHEQGWLPHFESSTQELFRFAQAKELVGRLNLRHPQAHFSTDSPFTLLSNEEFRSLFTPHTTIHREIAPPLTLTPRAATATTTTADDFNVDWTTSGCVNPVQNQGKCGSCWAFAAVLAVESAMCLSTKVLPSLSQQQVTSCDTKTGTTMH